MAYRHHEKAPGGDNQQQQPQYGQFEEGIEPVVHQYGQYPEHYNPQPSSTGAHLQHASPHTAATANATTSSRKNRVLWILLCLVVVLLVLVIGLGAGLGAKLAQANSRASSSDSSAQATVTKTVTSGASAGPTATYTAATSTATPTIPCPSQNLTLYTANTAVDTQFRLYCGFDFSGSEAADLASVDTVSMEACMDVCASTEACQGAGWGSTGQSSVSSYPCYLKTNLTKAHDANDDSWCFALNLNNTDSVSI